MHALPTLRRLAAAASFASLAVCAAWPGLASAAPVTVFAPFEGLGNVAVFDAAAGTGGWVGSIDQVAPPVVADPLALVSVVLFQLDALTRSLSGSFEFSTLDLSSTLFGSLSGSYDNADILLQGGQFSVDYNILGGTGQFGGASGFGLSFVDFNAAAPASAFNNYREAGLLAFSVPEPASYALLGVGLCALRLGRRGQVSRVSNG